MMRNKIFKDETELFFSNPRKDFLVRLIKIIWGIIVFMAGLVLGLSLNTHFSRYFTSQTELFFPRSIYTSSCELDPLNIKYFVKPCQLMHAMTDDELFWRASMVPKKEEYPLEKTPKVAFMFMIKGSLPFLPLWERFFKGHDKFYTIYVHSYPYYELNVSAGSPFYGRHIPIEKVKWGSIWMVDAQKRLMANALLDYSNEHFVLISESSIPVFNFPTVYDYLMKSSYSFVESVDENLPHVTDHYNDRMAPDIMLSQWRKGSQWVELNRSLAVDIVAERKYYSIFKKYCNSACYPDEHYIPTYLSMFHGASIANRSVMWADWSRGGPHPTTYGGKDITKNFIKSIRNNGTICMYNAHPTSVCFLFATKFAPDALEPLLKISSAVMRF
ncbi:glycosyltransferase BC10-like [Typha angustifolia]|uniref:glycosyltransferase BC10-like n=1 Tax=Typha angustifolia TaxID=59011 RepID=UPI003C2F66B4